MADDALSEVFGKHSTKKLDFREKDCRDERERKKVKKKSFFFTFVQPQNDVVFYLKDSCFDP